MDGMESALNYIACDVGFRRRVIGHFTEAMKRGYATSPAKGTIVELPGSKTIEYRHEEWRVLDTYVVTPQSAYSGGNTIVWYGPVPVWMMQYLGYYPEEAIPCLKAALKTQYDTKEFNGGRGPDLFFHDGCTYVNHVWNNDFRDGNGEEIIFGADGKKLGWHRYQFVYMVE